MFGLFGSRSLRDGQLGDLRRSGRYWRGRLDALPCGTFPLALIGGNDGPNPKALALAKELPDDCGPLPIRVHWTGVTVLVLAFVILADSTRYLR